MKKFFSCFLIISLIINSFSFSVLALEEENEKIVNDSIVDGLKDGSTSADFNYNLSFNKTLEVLYNSVNITQIISDYIVSKLTDNDYDVSVDSNDMTYKIIENQQVIYTGEFEYTLNELIEVNYSLSTEEKISFIKSKIASVINISNDEISINMINDGKYNVTINNVSHDFIVVEAKDDNLEINSNNQNDYSLNSNNQISVNYSTHVAFVGWQSFVSNGQMAGTEGQGLRLEGIKINITNTDLAGNVEYQTHVENVGWQEYKSNGDISGTEGKALRLEAIRIKLTGELADKYDIYYSVHVQNMGWLGWAKNGESAGSAGYAYRLEGIKIQLVAKNSGFDIGDVKAYNEHDPLIFSDAHVQNMGWIGTIADRVTIGTEGLGLRMEAFALRMYSYGISGNIEYSSHIQNVGWQEFKPGGEISGTEGQSLRLEAIKIRLTGEMEEKYDIYYRAHVQNYGWLDWAKNGEEAGSIGLFYRMEAMQIKLVKKGNAAPGATTRPMAQGKFVYVNGNTYYYDADGNMANDFKVIDGTKYFFNSLGVLIGSNVRKVIDISAHNGTIDWDTVKNSGTVDAVILRVAAGSAYEDSKLARNVSELKRVGIPYGVYIYSYAEDQIGTVSGLGTMHEAALEAERINNAIKKYNMNLSFPIYYDLEVWENRNNSLWTTNNYRPIINAFANKMSEYGYEWRIYTNKAWADTALNEQNIRNKIDWVAQYNHNCTYTGSYSGWQYSSKESIPGINGNVDVNVWFN